MVVGLNRRPTIRPQQNAMMVPKKPRSPFGNGQSIWGGMPDYLTGIQSQPMPEMGQTAAPADFEAMIAELNAQAAQMPKPQQAQMQQPQAPSPVAGLMSQKFEKPGMTWADKLGMLGGTLMDYDGTLGSGNADRARGMYEQRVGEQQGEFEADRQQKIMMAAAQGDPTALAMLDPIGARNFQYQQGRDERGDQLTERAWLQDQQRYETDQEYRERTYADSRSDEAYRRQQDARANAPRDIWQSAGDGVIFNQRTGATQNTQGGGGGVGASGGGYSDDPNAFMIPTSSMDYNPFVQMQFGGNLTQGAPSFFDNGEIYTPGDQSAAPGGGRPPNVTESYNRYRSSGLAKNDNKELESARTEAVAVTTNLIPQIQEMRSLVGTFPMGITSDAQYQIGRVAGDAFGLGMSPEEQGNRDAFLGQSKKLALSMGRDLKPFSNSDRDWIQAMVANPGQTKESAAQVLDTLEKMAEYRLFYAQGAEMWQNQYGGLSMTDANGKNFFESWGEWSSMNPVTGKQFSGDAPTSGPTTRGSVRSGAAGGRGATPQYERTATNPQTGEKIGLVNGQWVPIQ